MARAEFNLESKLLENRVSQEIGVLIVDDDPIIRDHLETLCRENISGRLQFFQVSNLKDAFSTLYREISIRVVLLDKDLDQEDGTREDGIEAIPEIKKIRPVQVVVITGSDDLDDAIRAMEYDADAYIRKGFTENIKIAKIRKSIHHAKLQNQAVRSEMIHSSKKKPPVFPGKSPEAARIRNRIPIVSLNKAPVLLLGPTGAGKSTVARMIHHYRVEQAIREGQKEADIPYVAKNMGAIPQDLIESELFGHEKGSFTGADNDRVGAFELADGGVIFLDEIGEASPSVQTTLLQILDDGQFYRVGGKKPIRTRVKIIAATNRDLQEMIQKGTFREDLYYRLSITEIGLPSLAERGEDIPYMIEVLWSEVCDLAGIFPSIQEFPKELTQAISQNAHKLVGNNRMLRNELVRLLMEVPKDKRGLPILSKWKSVEDFFLNKTPAKKKNKKSAIKPSELLKSGIDFDDTAIAKMGLSPFLDEFRKKILADAVDTFGTNKDVSHALRWSASQVANYVKRYGIQTAKSRRAKGGLLHSENLQ